jgi:hypothetical protein
MAGYSGTPLAKKLGVKERSRVAVPGSPPGFARTLGTLPEGATIVPLDGEPLDLVVFFTKSSAELKEQFPGLAARIGPAGVLWISWPKKASGVATDLSENVVRDIGLAAGLVDVKVCAVDEVWSGLKFVYRLKDRPAGK